MTVKNVPLLINLASYGYNRGLGGDFTPEYNKDGTIAVTYCNQFIQYVLNGFGYGKMNGMYANEMCDFMSKPENGWISVSDEVAQSHANQGVLVIAGHKNNKVVNGAAHGHVCLVIPGILEKSNSWGRAVPKVVNIGKDVFFGKKVSFAFTPEEMPTFFALSEMI